MFIVVLSVTAPELDHIAIGGPTSTNIGLFYSKPPGDKYHRLKSVRDASE